MWFVPSSVFNDNFLQSKWQVQLKLPLLLHKIWHIYWSALVDLVKHGLFAGCWYFVWHMSGKSFHLFNMWSVNVYASFDSWDMRSQDLGRDYILLCFIWERENIFFFLTIRMKEKGKLFINLGFFTTGRRALVIAQRFVGLLGKKRRTERQSKWSKILCLF